VTLNSMTGFARTEGANDNCTWVWEAKSVNAKGMDARLRLPSGFETLDAVIRDNLKKRFRRGFISISLNVNWHHAKSTYQINMETLERFLQAMPEIHKLAPDLHPVTMDGLLAAKGVVESIEDTLGEAEQMAFHEEILQGLNELLTMLERGRQGEGAALGKVLHAQITEVENLCQRAVGLTALFPEMINKRLHEQLADLCATVPALPEERLAQEAAMLMLKADVREELDRLRAHVDAARELMMTDGSIGRQFDFLCQELNREANTLCSKSADVQLTRVGLALKTTIDQMREQVQNIE
jgi:uncharacterized protein (TIGR00255 family)